MEHPSNKVIIIAVEYMEKSYQETRKCIEATGLPVHYVKRNPLGIGSLAEAINRGFWEAGAVLYQYAWIVTNVTFNAEICQQLITSMEWTGAAAIHPSFASDHIHQVPDGSRELKIAPFIEFTCPMVRTNIFAVHMLDEKMPYWGHDLDWGYRMWQLGHKIYVDHEATVGHTYIRNNKKPDYYTSRRLALRRASDNSTRRELARKYGEEWRDIVFPKTEQQIGAFYDQVKNKVFHIKNSL